MICNTKEDQLCASLIRQVIKVSNDYVKSKDTSTSRGASIIPTNEFSTLRQVLFKGKCKSSNQGQSRTASVISGTNELAELRKVPFGRRV